MSIQGKTIDKILTPTEVKFIMLAIASCLEDIEEILNEPQLNKGAKKDLAEILRVGYSVRGKVEKLTGQTIKLDPYEEGDEKEFIEPDTSK